jgi:hypothetical protein
VKDGNVVMRTEPRGFEDVLWVSAAGHEDLCREQPGFNRYAATAPLESRRDLTAGSVARR